jgi:hypothetical protein
MLSLGLEAQRTAELDIARKVIVQQWTPPAKLGDASWSQSTRVRSGISRLVPEHGGDSVEPSA